MMTVRAFLATAVGFAVLGAGCGGSEPAATADSAALAPADAGLYASIDSDRDSSQWQQLEELLARIPGGEKAVEELLSDALGEAGLNWDEDVAPALGPELVVVLPGGSAQPVGLTQPDGEAKLQALLAKSDQKLVSREVEGWTAIAESEAALDAYEKSLDEGLLSEQAAFTEAMAGLPEDALARFYVNGTGLQGALGRAAGTASGLGVGGLDSLGLGAFGLGTFALAIAAEDDGLRLVGTADQEGLPASFSPSLLQKVPAGAFVAGTLKGGGALTEQFRKALAGNEEQLREFEQQSGIAFEDVFSLFEGETVFYVRPGLPIPEITLAMQSTGGQLATIDKLFERFADLSKTTIQSAVEDGVTVKRLTAENLSVRYAETDGVVLVTTGPGGIRAFGGSGPKLVDDDAFEAAAGAVGYEGSTTALVYVDVDGIVPLLQGFLGLAGGGVPGAADGLGKLADALEALDSFALNVTTQGDQARLEGFLSVR